MFGCGYLGAVHAACMTRLGHDVVGVDVVPDHVAALSRGEPPFFEPGLPGAPVRGDRQRPPALHHRGLGGGRRDVHFVCVGTPQRLGEYAADMHFVDSAVNAILPMLKPGDVVVGKSTVPVGTAERLAERIWEAQPEAELIWNPEFLREGHAVADTLHPNRLVYGVAETAISAAATGKLDEVYAEALAAGTPKVVADLATAQLVKVAANSFLATKISFINAMAELCEATNADVTVLGGRHRPRRAHRPPLPERGVGFGGGCLPKDIRAFMARAGRARRRPGADLPARGRLDQHAAPRPDGRPRPRGVRRLDRRTPGRRARARRSSPNSDDIRDSPGAERGRPDAAAGRPGVR